MKGSHVVAFVLGSAVGGFATWIFAKSKYEALMEEEAESFRNKVRELQQKNKEESAPKETPEDTKKRNDEMVESLLEGVKEIQKNHQYKNYSDADVGTEESSKVKGSEDYVRKKEIEEIDEDTFNEDDSDYAKEGITLYMDGDFYDDADQHMSDGYLSETIGIEMRDHLIETEDVGTVYVRNHKKKTDYEIICLAETWKEVHDVD